MVEMQEPGSHRNQQADGIDHLPFSFIPKTNLIHRFNETPFAPLSSTAALIPEKALLESSVVLRRRDWHAIPQPRLAPPTMKSTILPFLSLPFLTVPFLLPQAAGAVSLACDNVRVDGKKFDFSKLGGRHSISVIDESKPPAEYNTTWTIDLCQPLKKISDIRDADQCPSGTRGTPPRRIDSSGRG